MSSSKSIENDSDYQVREITYDSEDEEVVVERKCFYSM
jgi:hypothetical protein